MSKSKKNTVDPDDIIAAYGADTARWFMLSDSPPDRDVIWTEEGVQGAWRFVQRLWRLVGDAASMRSRARRAAPAGFCDDGARAAQGRAPRARAQCPRTSTRLRFNVCVAHIYEFANAFGASLGDVETEPAADYRWAVREAADILVRLFHPMMPHLAEECWAALGHKTLLAIEAVARSSSPRCWSRTPSRCRCRSTARSAPTSRSRATPQNAEIEAAVLALEAVQRALDGKPPKKVIVVPQPHRQRGGVALWIASPSARNDATFVIAKERERRSNRTLCVSSSRSSMVALKSAQVDRFVARPNPAQPVVLVFGPDAGLVRERAEALDPRRGRRSQRSVLAGRGSTATSCRRSRRAWSRRRTPSRCSAAGARSGSRPAAAISRPAVEALLADAPRPIAAS